MLSERTQELLTAFVDGALTRRERKNVLRLLNGSSEARDFLRVLHENVHRLKQLPARTLPRDFPNQVLQAIKDQGLQPTPVYPRSTSARRGMPRWAGITVAASVMLLVAGGIIALSRNHEPVGPAVAKQETPKNVENASNEGPKNQVVPPPPAVEAPILDSGSRLALAELNQKSFELARELKTQSGVHLNLTAKNDGKSLARLETAFQHSGIKLVIDPDAQVRMRKGEPVLVYLENVKPEELQSILRQLGKEETKSFTSVQVESLSNQDQTQVMASLGVSKKEYDAPSELFRQTMMPAPPLPGSKTKPPQEVKPIAPVDPERLAVAVTPKSAKSNEVKRFVNYRQLPAQGSLRVLLVLKPE